MPNAAFLLTASWPVSHQIIWNLDSGHSTSTLHTNIGTCTYWLKVACLYSYCSYATTCIRVLKMELHIKYHKIEYYCLHSKSNISRSDFLCWLMFQLTLISFFNHVLPIYVIFLASFFPDLEQLWTDSWMPAISMLGNLFVYMTTSTRFFFAPDEYQHPHHSRLFHCRVVVLRSII